MKRLLSTLVVACSAFGAQANEGMWQPQQLPQLAEPLKAMGLSLPIEQLSSLDKYPLNAVVSLGGCTASFVSDQGLIVTNHHCAYGSAQYNSTADNNLLKNGFLAKTKADELPAAPGSRVYVTKDVTDVSEQILADLEQLDGMARYNTVDRRKKALIAQCEADGTYRCQVANYHHNLEFYLIKQLMIKDMRLVYVPPVSIGKFGGDIDNWMWPRHTGDFSFFRAYVSPEGKSADYSKDNVPYTPPSHLKVAAKGVAQNDFVMVAGYPGRTNRYRTAEAVKNQFEWYYPAARDVRNGLIDTIKANSAPESDTRIKYESTLAGLANYAKNFQSMIDSYSHSDLLTNKKQLEQKLNNWIAADDQRQQEYGEAVGEVAKLTKKSEAHQARNLLLGYMYYTQMPHTASTLYRLAQEKQKPDEERESGYQQRDMDRFKQSLARIDRRYDAGVDQAMLAYLLHQYAQLPQKERVPAIDKAFAITGNDSLASINKTLAPMYNKTRLDDKKTRLYWMDQPVEAFKLSNDPFIKYAVATADARLAIENKRKALAGDFILWKPRYMAALIAYKHSQGQPVYADANSTLRITYGQVKGNEPRDGLWNKPFTTLQGITEKQTGKSPFNAPQAELDLINAKDYGSYKVDKLDSVPVNFLSTVDTTGGNSGSPTLNGKGELVGLLFDGVYESIIGDWYFNPEKNRSIHLDVRYMLWVMEKIDHADNLLKEMDIVHD